MTKYKQSVVQNDNVIDTLAEPAPETFTHWVADNVDHNVATLDGKGTFHGMGIINITSGSFGTELSPIKRQQLMKVKDVTKNKGIPIVSFVRTEISGFSSLSYMPLVELQFPHTLPNNMSSNLLWHSMYFFKPYRPSWSGYMQDISHGNHPGKSKITMLPIIDLLEPIRRDMYILNFDVYDKSSSKTQYNDSLHNNSTSHSG